MPAPSETQFDQTIRELAYYLYVCRGCREGQSERNWFEAKQQLPSTNVFSPDEVERILGEIRNGAMLP